MRELAGRLLEILAAIELPITRQDLYDQIRRGVFLVDWSALEVQRELARLKHRGAIHLDRNSNLRLTPRGLELHRRVAIDRLRLADQNPWDGVWRVVIFDVPEKYRGGRDGIRATLKRLGFRQMQRSVWITPWPCRAEVDVIRTHFGAGGRLLYLESSELDGDKDLRTYFNVKKKRTQS